MTTACGVAPARRTLGMFGSCIAR